MGYHPTVDYGGTPPAENGSSREMYFVAWSEFCFSPALPSPSTRHTERAIICSSSVRMTRTATRLASVEITPAVSALRDSCSAMPRKPSPSQMRARTSGAFSPMPPAKTSVSNPPSAAAKAPIHFFA